MWLPCTSNYACAVKLCKLWTKNWPAQEPKAMNDTPDGQFLMFSGARWCEGFYVFFFFASVVQFLRNSPLSSTHLTNFCLCKITTANYDIQKLLHHWPSYSTLVTMSFQIHRYWMLFLVQKILDSTNCVSSKSIENRLCACGVERHKLYPITLIN